jgi:hypothetical protein
MEEKDAAELETVSVEGMRPIQEFIGQLPTGELHVHLVGSAPAEIVLELGRRRPGRGARVPRTEAALRKFYEFSDPARIAAGSLGVRHMPSRNPDEYGFAQM